MASGGTDNHSVIDTRASDSDAGRSILRGLPSAAAAFVFAIGSLVLVGWVLGIEELRTLELSHSAVAANTAVAFCVAAVAFWSLGALPRRARRRIVSVCGICVSLIGVLTLAQYALGVDLGIDELLAKEVSPRADTSHPSRMGGNTAFSLTLLGLALALLVWEPRTGKRSTDVLLKRSADALLVAVAAIAFVALVGHAVSVPAFYKLATWTEMAPATAVTLLVLAIGILSGRADFLPTRLLANEGAAGAAARRLLPAAIILPLALAWISGLGQNAGLYGPEVRDLVLVGSLVAVLVVLVCTLALEMEGAALRGNAAEEAHRAAEARYQTLVEQLPLVTYVDKPDATASSIYISPQVTDLLGYRPEEWLEDPELFPKILHPDDRDRVLASHEAGHAAGKGWSFRYRVIARDGRTVWLRDDAVVARDDDGNALFVQGFLIDITPQIQAEQSLSTRNEELAALQETAMGVLRGLDLDTLLETILSRAGDLVGTSHAYLYLVEGDELEVHSATGVFTDNIGYRLRRGQGISGRVYETREPLVVDDYHVWSGRRPDFDALRFHAVVSVPLHSGADVVGVLGLAHADETRRFTPEETVLLQRFGDLVSLALENARLYAAAQAELQERRRTEEALRQAETKYRNLVENVPLVIYLDSLDEHSSAIYMSPQVEPILGYSADEWLADRELFPKLLHPDDRERVMAEIARTHETHDRFSCEYRLIARNGNEVWFQDEATHIFDVGGRPLFAQGFMLEVTEQKRAAAERERLLRDAQEARAVLAEQNERLLEVDRLKDEFIALVSHELRTPLTSIRGYLELLLVDELPREQREYLQVVERNSHRLLRLVSDLLLLAQIEAGKLTLEVQPLDLSGVVAESVEAARPAAEANGIELTFARTSLPLLDGDRARIAQVLDNLVSNAIKFTPAGGRVKVRSRIEGDAAAVVVEDTGIGIAPEEQAQLFERFYRTASATKRAIQGTGLGLSISKAIAEEHGGEIRVSSEQGVGTTFILRLPMPDTDVVGIGDRDDAAA